MCPSTIHTVIELQPFKGILCSFYDMLSRKPAIVDRVVAVCLPPIDLCRDYEIVAFPANLVQFEIGL